MWQTSSDFRGGDKGAGCPSSPSGRLLVLSLLLSESVMTTALISLGVWGQAIPRPAEERSGRDHDCPFILSGAGST